MTLCSTGHGIHCFGVNVLKASFGTVYILIFTVYICSLYSR